MAISHLASVHVWLKLTQTALLCMRLCRVCLALDSQQPINCWQLFLPTSAPDVVGIVSGEGKKWPGIANKAKSLDQEIYIYAYVA